MGYLSLEINPKDRDNNAIFFLPAEGAALAYKDQLTLTFKNASGEILQLKADESAFGIAWPDAFSKKAMNALHLQTEGKGVWVLEPIQKDSDEMFIRCKSTDKWEHGHDIQFTFSHFEGDRVEKPNHGQIESYGIYNEVNEDIEESFEIKLIAKSLPTDEKKDLNLMARPIGGNIVYVTDPGKPDNLNEISFYIKSSERDPVQVSAAKGVSRFRVSFDYGEGLGDLATATQASRFKLRVLRRYRNEFVQNKLQGDIDLYWEFRAASDVFLQGGSDDTIEFMFEDILSTTGLGITRVHIEYFDIPDYNDGYCFFDLVKSYPEANILNFNADRTTIDCRKEAEEGGPDVGVVNLSWSVYAVDFITLEYKYKGEIKSISSKDNEKFNIKEDKYPVELYEDTRFTLTAFIEKADDNGKLVEKRSDQRQLAVSIEPTLKQYAMQCFYAGDSADLAVTKCARKFHLDKLSDDNIRALVTHLKTAGYDDDYIYNATVSFYYQNGENKEWDERESHYKDIIMDILD